MQGREQFSTPTFLPWMRNLLIGLIAAYVVELLLRNAGVDVYALAWQPIGSGFRPWQPFTRYLVQGAGVFTVLFGALMLYFMVPTLWWIVDRTHLRDAALAGLAGGTLLPLLLDLTIADGGMLMGWSTFLLVFCGTVFGLSMPEDTLYLMFVIPVNGRFILWGTCVLSALALLVGAAFGHGAGEAFGTWAGVYGWWQLRGPGARRRDLKKKAASIERELRRFQVIEGGKAQGDQGREPDEWVN